MRTRVSERRIVALLLTLLAGECALLLAHLGVFGTGAWRAKVGATRAGVVIKSDRELRRRSVDSLIWENAAREEALYFHDSVLTLSQSTASLQLDPDTEIRLSENTLVTIEPPLVGAHGEIRLKFQKGNLQARNPYHPARISGEAWTVDVRAGSDLEFRQVGERDVEVRVTKGEAQLSSNGGAEQLKGGDWVRVENGHAEKLRPTDDLAWTSPPPARIYAHADSVPLALGWRGEAARLVIQTLGQKERTLDVSGTHAILELPLGKHRVYLTSRDRAAGAPLDVEVWRAPVIHLLTPRPRDRVDLDREVAFTWTRPGGAKRFDLVVGTRRLPNVNPPMTKTFGEPADLDWSVFGRDADGFEIPPPYAHPLFVRERPLSAPRLRPPTVRKPASDRGASWWRWILPVAHADDLWEADFDWEEVPGADAYALEIARTTDFREPVLMKTTGKTHFTWRGFEPGEYYWRVAAGSKRGRMGVFSEPEKVDLRTAAPAPAPPVRATAAVQPVPVAPPARVPASAPSVAPPPPPPARPLQRDRWIAWTPAYFALDVRAADAVRAKLKGGQPSGVSSEIPFGQWRADAAYQAFAWRPDPDRGYQSRLAGSAFAGALIRLPTWWGYGLDVRSEFLVRRRDAESIEAAARPGAGPALAVVYRGDRWQASLTGRATLQRDGVSAGARGLVRVRVPGGFTLGVGAEAGTLGTNAFGLFGFEF